MTKQIIVVKNKAPQPMCNCGGYTPPLEDILWFNEYRYDPDTQISKYKTTVLYGNEQQNDYKSASAELPDNWKALGEIIQDYQRRLWFVALELAPDTSLVDAYLVRAELLANRTVELKYAKLPKINNQIITADCYLTTDKTGNVYISFNRTRDAGWSNNIIYLAMLKATPISETAFTFNITVDIQAATPSGPNPPPDFGYFIALNYTQDRVATFSVFGNRVAVWNTSDLSFIGSINTPFVYNGVQATGMPTDIIPNSPNRGLTYMVDNPDDTTATSVVYAISLDTMSIVNSTIIPLIGLGMPPVGPPLYYNYLLAFPLTVDMKGRLIMKYQLSGNIPFSVHTYVAYADPIGNGQVAQPLFQHVTLLTNIQLYATSSNFVTKPSSNQKMVYAAEYHVYPPAQDVYPTFGAVVFVSPEQQLEIYKIVNPWSSGCNNNIAWLRE